MARIVDEAALSESAINYLDDFCDGLDEAESKSEYVSVAEDFHLKTSGYGTLPGIGRLPSSVPEYGSLTNHVTTTYVAKCRYPSPKSPLVRHPSLVIGSGSTRQHSNENFAEARIWYEAKERGQEELFAPVVAYDDETFRWLVMVEVDQELDYSPYQEHMYRDELSELQQYAQQMRDKGWILHDLEIGRLGNRVVAFDYGGLWRNEGKWFISQDTILAE